MHEKTDSRTGESVFSYLIDSYTIYDHSVKRIGSRHLDNVLVFYRWIERFWIIKMLSYRLLFLSINTVIKFSFNPKIISLR